MALQPQDLRTVTTLAARVRIKPTRVDAKTFAADAGGSAKTLPIGTVVTYNTSTNLWVQVANGGANGTGLIRGIVFPNPVTIKASGGGEVLGNVMLSGEAHFDDLQGDGATTAQLRTIVRTQDPSLRELGIFIEGLAQVR